MVYIRQIHSHVAAQAPIRMESLNESITAHRLDACRLLGIDNVGANFITLHTTIFYTSIKAKVCMCVYACYCFTPELLNFLLY